MALTSAFSAIGFALLVFILTFAAIAADAAVFLIPAMIGALAPLRLPFVQPGVWIAFVGRWLGDLEGGQQNQGRQH